MTTDVPTILLATAACWWLIPAVPLGVGLVGSWVLSLFGRGSW